MVGGRDLRRFGAHTMALLWMMGVHFKAEFAHFKVVFNQFNLSLKTNVVLLLLITRGKFRGYELHPRFLAVIPVAALCLDVMQRCRIRKDSVLKGWHA